MSDKKNLKERLKALFLSEDEVKLATDTLKDGTVVEAEAFEVGQAVVIVNGEEKMPAPAGEHTLEDGRIMVVNEEGVIAEIKEAKAEDEGEEELSVEDVANALLRMDERIKKLEGQESLSKEDLEGAKTEQAKKLEDQAKEINTLRSQITKLSSQAGAKPNKPNPQPETKKATLVQLGSNTREMVDNYYSNLNQN